MRGDFMRSWICWKTTKKRTKKRKRKNMTRRRKRKTRTGSSLTSVVPLTAGTSSKIARRRPLTCWGKKLSHKSATLMGESRNCSQKSRKSLTTWPDSSKKTGTFSWNKLLKFSSNTTKMSKGLSSKPNKRLKSKMKKRNELCCCCCHSLTQACMHPQFKTSS